jgi:hypothetical protein
VIKVKLDTTNFKPEAIGKQFVNAARRSLDRAGASAKTDISRSVAADTGLGVAKVKERIKVEKTDAATRTVTADPRRVPIIEFKAKGPEPSRGQGAGVSYKLPTGRGRLPHAFIAPGKGGRRAVFQRIGAAREPLEEKFGPSVFQSAAKFARAVAEKAIEVLRERLRHEMSRGE